MHFFLKIIFLIFLLLKIEWQRNQNKR